MSKSWSQPPSRRAPGSFLPNRSLRRTAPYPSKEERGEEHKNALDRYEELEKSQTYPTVNYEGYTSQEQANSTAKVAVLPIKSEGTPADRRKALYQKFYKQVQEERRPADCVVLSVTNESPEYSISLGQCLQDRGLSVEMLCLHAESGLTHALQDVRADGSPLCILVEQTNIALCSCTVIIFAQSLKIHRNMPKDQALDFVVAEYSRGLVQERPPKDPADIAAETSQMLDDFLDREKRIRHYVPSDVRHLFMFLAEGVHLYPEELETLSEYVLSRQEQAQVGKTEGEGGSMLPAGLGKPPPLLPTPSSSQLQSDHSPSSLSFPGICLAKLNANKLASLPSPAKGTQGTHKDQRGSFSKTNPPPLMSKPPSALSLGSPPSHSSLSRVPLLDTPPYPRGPLRGYRFGPITARGPTPLSSSRPPLLSRPGGPLLPRPRGPLL